jgi:acyl transferase domain-containing protein/3-hydroxymyristoyl/3-hydroxydecanoyl-(acyl carrier protein) dehydratase
MNYFEPIAITGQGCVLPGCFSPEDLWDIVARGAVATGHAGDTDWRTPISDLLVSPGASASGDRSWHDIGGYVRDFASHFDATRIDLGPLEAADLDPVFLWSFYAAAQALERSGHRGSELLQRTGLIMGNLSYPSRSFSRYFEEQYLHRLFPEWKNDRADASPLNRFMSGLPAQLTARVNGIGGEAFAIDAACASSLYALKLACDRLHRHEADMMLVGGVCAADQLFLHVGFTALNALSPTGQTRPFNAGADGLIPAEGAAFITVRRVADAVRDGDKILGVVRSVGLSNDGRSGGFLSPARAGQVRSMRLAFEQTELLPEDISYVECHATGTSTGDAIEIESLREVYGTGRPLFLGSLKGNIGHSITASGVAGIIKVLGAFQHRQLPPTPGVQPLSRSLSGTPFRVLEESLAWEAHGKRVAAISNFGFGGNNAHLLLEEWIPGSAVKPATSRAPIPSAVAVIGLSVRSAAFDDTTAFMRNLTGDAAPSTTTAREVSFVAGELNFPPNDLKHTLGQQLLLMKAAGDVLGGRTIEKAATGVFIGMGGDAEVNRYGFRKRFAGLLEQGGVVLNEAEKADLESKIGPVLNAAGVIGTMPNIPANRINNQFDLTGAGFTVSGEELSGTTALRVALAAIRSGELTTAVVGSVDISDEFVNKEALRAVLGIDAPAADLAITLLLKDAKRAEQDGDTVLALVDDHESEGYKLDPTWLRSHTGYAHCADGLLQVAVAIWCTQQRLRPAAAGHAFVPALEGARGFCYSVAVQSLFGTPQAFTIASVPVAVEQQSPANKTALFHFAAASLLQLRASIDKGATGGEGPFRIVIISDEDNLPALRHQAAALLEKKPLRAGWINEKICYYDAPIGGKLAFAFTGAASAYPQMGAELLQGFPGLAEALAPYCTRPSFAAEWIYEDGPKSKLPFYQLAGSSFICQIHAVFLRQLLRLQPDAALGLSSGETNAMFALGVWEDMDGLLEDIAASELYTSALGVDFSAVRTHWGLGPEDAVHWDNWLLRAPVAQVERLLESEPRAYMTIVNTAQDCVIGGDSAACARIIEQIGAQRAVALRHDIAVHCAAVRPYEKEWRALHTRPARTIPGVAFYSNYLDGVYETTTENVATALTGQAVNAIDFPRIVEKAWADGIRIFVELGPRNSLSTAIRAILGHREHLCVSLDQYGKSSLVQAYRAAAELWCAGSDIALDALTPAAVPAAKKGFRLSYPLHPADITVSNHQENTAIAPMDQKIEKAPAGNRMAAAPRLLSAQAVQHLCAVVEIQQPIARVEPLVQRTTERMAVTENVHFNASASPVSLLLEQHAAMTNVHRRYLETQLAAQQHFNDLMQQLAGLAGTVEETQAYSPEPLVMDQFREELPPAALPEATPVAAPERKAETPRAEPRPTNTKPAAGLPGPKFSRSELEVLSSGKISDVFGPAFAGQDQYAIQVRMPEPPLLLCDRVTGIRGEAMSLGLGTIWTETDVTPSSWYLHNNRMPPGIFIEAGQADLLLISWLGIDAQNKGDRAYRLLGCELQFYGELPQPGETLCYEIHVDGYAKSGETTLFFFHYDCHINGKLRISVRNGQAGFFTKQELIDSKGVIWDEAAAFYSDAPPVSLPNATRKESFTIEEVIAYTQGDMVSCFGPELKWTQPHTRTPRSQAGYQNFIRTVTDFNLAGGPHRKGYLRAESAVRPDDWYFKGHFKNDECMPGTLMADACLQMMAFYMVGAGLSVGRDGWRFEPVTEEQFKFVCRGQVTPESGTVVYEIFVSELTDGPFPTIYAHVLTTVDGNRAFLCERLGLRLIPDYPMKAMTDLHISKSDGHRIADYKGFRFDHESLIACALGKPSAAFGPDFDHYDGLIRSPRLPGPPYHFMTRIPELNAQPGNYNSAPSVTAEYDFTNTEWYFGENGKATMPYGVMMEVALQPCGWLSTFVCQNDIKGQDLLFRNLDGTATLHREIGPDDGTIVTKTTMTSASLMGSIIIVKFDVTSKVGDELVFSMNTVFGFFDADSMKNQKGLAISDEERGQLALPANFEKDLRAFPAAYFTTSMARLPASKLLMLDRLSAYYPQGGKMGKGYIRGEKVVRTDEWFFKAHFFQDPVQPGSLGIEAMLQLMQLYLLEQDLHAGFREPEFEPVLVGGETEWHYRGQVTPEKGLITVDFDVLELRVGEGSVTVEGIARLWVDGLKIYQAPRIGMRIREKNI